MKHTFFCKNICRRPDTGYQMRLKPHSRGKSEYTAVVH